MSDFQNCVDRIMSDFGAVTWWDSGLPYFDYQLVVYYFVYLQAVPTSGDLGGVSKIEEHRGYFRLVLSN